MPGRCLIKKHAWLKRGPRAFQHDEGWGENSLTATFIGICTNMHTCVECVIPCSLYNMLVYHTIVKYSVAGGKRKLCGQANRLLFS